ncbi:hypothetical protein BC834DRAFT_191754 [Gloeopeniophorella convolvens]|nr:hypothetical protein BC834DRAFT_191754 [Gloeopeniophorella convolvens]
MLRYLVLLLPALGGAAYQITAPSENCPWTTTGPHVINWVGPISNGISWNDFNITLFHCDDSRVRPCDNQVLAENVDGTTGTFTLDAGLQLPAGSKFAVQFERHNGMLHMITARSARFAIVDPQTLEESARDAPALAECAPGANGRPEMCVQFCLFLSSARCSLVQVATVGLPTGPPARTFAQFPRPKFNYFRLIRPQSP